MKESTEPFKETPEEQEARMDAMLRSMVTETALWAIETGESPPSFTLSQISNYCGVSTVTARRILQRALTKIRAELAKSN